MKYQPPFGSPGANDPYVDRNTSGAVQGSKVPAKALEHPQREIVAVIEDGGLTPDDASTTQLRDALRRVLHLSGRYRSASGVSNAPPGSPADRETWVVGTAPTGDWTGQANKIAEWNGTVWLFTAPPSWFMVGMPDRTDWRWDHTLGQWSIWKAAEALRGPIELATLAEALAGTDTERGVTPAVLRQVLTKDRGRPRLRHVYLTSGTHTPHADLIFMTVEVVGGGGGGGISSGAGGRHGGGGGAGGKIEVDFAATDLPGGAIPITIGAGGAGTSSIPEDGSAGSLSRFGDNAWALKAEAYGGSGGTGATDAPGLGGNGGSASCAAPGARGITGTRGNDGSASGLTYPNYLGGHGWGGQGGAWDSTTGTGFAGGAGLAGVVVITEHLKAEVS